MSLLLDASGALLFLSGLAAFVYEMWALHAGNGQTVSEIVERWVNISRPWGTILIVALEFGLQLLGLHFLGVSL